MPTDQFKTSLLSFALLFCTLSVSMLSFATGDMAKFTEADKQFLKQFSLQNLPPLPAAPDNSVADNLQAAKLGQKLFFDPRLSANGAIACSTCHQPQLYFTDGLALSQALGTTRRSAPSVLGAAWSPWLFWDGRKDSLWSQALGPLESSDEHGISRVQLVKKIARHYPEQYQQVFGTLPPQHFFKNLPASGSPQGDASSRANWRALSADEREGVNRIFSNVGKALMAYQRRLELPPARFDTFVSDLFANGGDSEVLNLDEIAGMRLFMGRANCASCHNGPWFTNHEFHNIGAPERNRNQVDLGRFEGVATLVKDEFTCLSQWSDAGPEDCAEMRFLKRQGQELVGAFKTPTLRNIGATAPYMQAGQYANLEEVLSHYNLPKPPFYDPKQHPNRPHFDILPLRLEQKEIEQIIAFLNTLTSPLPLHDQWWQQP